MGGVEDDEPPLKRVKVCSAQLRGLLNGQSTRELTSCSSSDSMARPLESQGDDDVVGSKGLVKKIEFVRIIAEALYSLGFKKTGAHLEAESGIPLHSPTVNLFVQHILEGEWDDCVVILHKIGLADEKIIKLASFVILEQKFFELLNGGKVMDALKTLRKEITPLCINNDRVRVLSSCIVSPAQHLIDGVFNQDFVKPKPRSELLEELRRLLPPTVMVPENRLVHLVEQALDLQLDACRYHNSLMGEISLLTDHQCGRDQIPSHTLQILTEHNDEVWFLQFSHDGRFLASSSSDSQVIVWEVKMDDRAVLKHRLSGHQKPVSYISWSPDNQQFLTCGGDEVVRRWDVSSGECLHIYEKNSVGLISCGWDPDGMKLFSGATDRSIIMWDLDGKELDCWKGQRTIRTSDLEIATDMQIITVCKETVILLFGWESKTERQIQEDQIITSFALSRDSKFLLVSLLNQEIHLWDIEGDAKLVARYKGHKRSRFIVRSCFGGLDQAFIASGSEDSQVFVWHRGSGDLIGTLPGHSGAVNCVSWNPVNPHMLASASDDRTIRIWGLNQIKLHVNGVYSNGNGIYYCNGSS